MYVARTGNKLSRILADPFGRNYEHKSVFASPEEKQRRMEQILLFHRQQELINSQSNMSLLEPQMVEDDMMFDHLEDERGRGLIFGLFKSIQGGNLSGIVVLSIIITVVILVVLACYLMMRFMHRALSGGDPKGSFVSPYSNVVIHSKRVYEIQAEEGVFNSSDSSSEEEQNSSSPEISSQEPSRASLRRPETGDLKQIREYSNSDDDVRQFMRKKEKQVHKDSVCGFLFRPQPSPNLV